MLMVVVAVVVVVEVIVPKVVVVVGVVAVAPMWAADPIPGILLARTHPGLDSFLRPILTLLQIEV